VKGFVSQSDLVILVGNNLLSFSCLKEKLLIFILSVAFSEAYCIVKVLYCHKIDIKFIYSNLSVVYPELPRGWHCPNISLHPGGGGDSPINRMGVLVVSFRG